MAKTSSRYHIIVRNNGWAVKREGSSKAADVFEKKTQAIKASGRFQKQNYDVIVHRMDGTISQWRRGKK